MSFYDFDIRIVRNDGAEFIATDERTLEWVVQFEGTDGFGEQQLTVNTRENVLTDGSSFESKRVDAKDRTIRGFYVGKKDRRTVRDEVQSFFNPKHTFRLYVHYDGETRWLEGELYAFKCELRKADWPVEFIATFLFLDPYYKSVYRNDRPFTDSIPMFGFPFVSHAAEDTGRNIDYPAGCMPSVRTFDGKNTVYNYGNVPCKFCAIVKARGALVNPAIHKDGKFIRIMDTMVAGDELVIDFEPQLAEVTMNGESVIHKCDRASTFIGMDMQVGPNMFSFECDNGNSNDLADVRILFNASYLGV